MSAFGGTTTKLMSLSVSEFADSMAKIGAHQINADGSRRFDLSPGHVDVNYAPQPSVRLGGLLELPRAVVTINFAGVSDSERAEFLRKFEIAFQRGGG